MDPDETLAKLRELSAIVLETPQTYAGVQRSLAAAHDISELFESLDDWLLAGGFIPHDWALAQKWNRRNG